MNIRSKAQRKVTEREEGGGERKDHRAGEWTEIVSFVLSRLK
jgi:hypothetical protein